MSAVRTVLGDVAFTDLGLVLPHEHLVNDNAVAFRPRADPVLRALLDAPVSPELAWLLADHPYENADNCRLDNCFGGLAGDVVTALMTDNPRALFDSAASRGR